MMKRKQSNRLYVGFRFLLMSLFLSSLLGCTSKETEQIEGYPELATIEEVAEMAPSDEEAELRRYAALDAIAREPLPPYVINGGDIYTLRVYDNPELSVENTVITPDGYITVGLVGPVKIAQLTVTQATEKIENALTEYIKQPKVILIPCKISSQMATLSGKVSKAGRFLVTDGMRLADLIAMGEGFASGLTDGRQTELSDLSTSVFVRNGRIVPVDFNAAVYGESMNNIEIRGGDYVYISTRADKIVSVIGEVSRPKYVTWYENVGIVEAIANAGGLQDAHADNVVVIRGGLTNPKIYRVNIAKVMKGEIRNPRLESGDILYVPKDGISEYNVFIRKLMPTGQLINMLLTPGAFFMGL